MIQHTLHKYFPSRRPFAAAPKTTFLRLPFKVRREIYLLSGLPTDITIYLNHIPSSNGHCIQEYDPHDRENWPIEPDITPRSFSLSHFLDGYLPLPQIHLNRHCGCIDHRSNARHDASNWWCLCKCPPLPWQLLYVSKAIEVEVSSIFYSENHFSIFRDSLGGLSGLNSLPKAALREMRNLSICLNYFDRDSSLVGTRHFGKGRQFGPESWDVRCHATCAASKQQRLFSKAKRHHEMSSIHELQELCLVLKHHIQPNQLKLSFTCDVADIEIAEEVLRPLSELPLLRECTIRLDFFNLPDDPTDYTPLTHLSEKLVHQLTKSFTHGKFNFTALPTEIQLQILSYTSLVTPYDLIWGLNTPISTIIKTPFYEPRTFPWRNYPSLPECCNACQPYPPSSSASFPSPEICSCWPKHAGFSSTCTCWRFPLHLFLVSKGVKGIAEAVFYGQNHFWVLPMWLNSSRKLEIYHFLTRIGEAKRYLRYLTWEMSWRVKEEWGGYLQQGDSTHSQWLTTLSLLSTIPQGQLTLTIDTQFSQSGIYLHNGGWEYGDTGVVVPSSTYISEAEHTFSISKMIADDFVERGIRFRDLWWHFKWPKIGEWQGEGEAGLGRDEYWEETERSRDRGALLEKMVMGPNYEGEERGKFERRAQWNGYRDSQPPW